MGCPRVVLLAVCLQLSSCAGEAPYSSAAVGDRICNYDYISSRGDRVGFRSDSENVYTLIQGTDLDFIGEDCSSDTLLCVKIPFGVFSVPRKMSTSVQSWNVSGWTFSISAEDSDNILSRWRIYGKGDDWHSVRFLYSAERGIEEIEILESPPQFEGWKSFTPLHLRGRGGLLSCDGRIGTQLGK